jgi:hypothetical protein
MTQLAHRGDRIERDVSAKAGDRGGRVVAGAREFVRIERARIALEGRGNLVARGRRIDRTGERERLRGCSMPFEDRGFLARIETRAIVKASASAALSAAISFVRLSASRPISTPV